MRASSRSHGCHKLGTHVGDFTKARQEAFARRYQISWIAWRTDRLWMWYVLDMANCDSRMLIPRRIDHVKSFLEKDQQEALKQYTTVIHAIRKTNSITPHLSKSTSSPINLRPTYLCIQCPNVATPDQRDKHEKAHALCKIWVVPGQ